LDWNFPPQMNSTLHSRSLPSTFLPSLARFPVSFPLYLRFRHLGVLGEDCATGSGVEVSFEGVLGISRSSRSFPVRERFLEVLMVARKGIDREADLRRQIFLSIIWKISGRTSSE